MEEPSARWALSLLKRAKPFELVSESQERVWAKLQGRHGAVGWRRTRFALATASLLVAGLFASAALGQWPGWLARVIHPAPIDTHAEPSSRAPISTPALRPSESAPSVSAPSPVVPAGAVRGPSTAHPRQPSKSATPEESESLLAAMRALRVERDPGRARTLAAQYLARYPKGALAEEALVLLVEAAVAHGDSDATALARRYVELYPKGGFAAEVRRSLAGAGQP